MKAVLLIGLTLLVLLYLLVNHIAGSRISANARYIAGLILLIAFLAPYKISLFDIPMPSWMGTDKKGGLTVTVDVSKDEHFSEITETGSLSFEEETESKPLDLWKTAGVAVYITGLLIYSFLTVKKHIALKKLLKRSCVPPSEALVWQFDMLCGKMRFRKKPTLCVCRDSVALALGAPFTFGIFRRKVVIPQNVCEEDAEMLLEHELYHCKRHDSLFRLLLVIASAMYWFYLPVLIFVRTLFTVCEESCDERVTEDKDDAYRVAYGKLLVRYAARGGALPVSFSSMGKKLKKRIETLFSRKRRREGYALICLVAYLWAFLTGVDFFVLSNTKVLQRGEICFDAAEGLSPDDELYAMTDELFHACMQFDCLDSIFLCQNVRETGDFSYLRMEDLYYKGYFIATIITESRDKSEFSAVSTYCDEMLAEFCIGIRLIYEGERKPDGSMQYTRFEILSESSLLDYYVWLLWPEDERGDTFRDLPEYDWEEGWEENVIRMAYEKDPDIVPFYEVLIEKVS